MIQITKLSEHNKNIHFKNSKNENLSILIHEKEQNTPIQTFNISTDANVEYWISSSKHIGDKKITFLNKETNELLLIKDFTKKIILIQVWFGPIPDYFWYHYETTKNLKDVDFLFITDQNITLDSPNYKLIKSNNNEVVDKVSELLGSKIEIKNNKKVCDLKASLGDVFYEHIKDYEYFGCYDIDTLFGDVEKYVHPHLGLYDIISVGNETYHNRLSGPFLIMRNTKELRTLYKTQEFIKCFESENVECFEENVLDKIAKEKFKIKLIYSMNTNLYGKNLYENVWSGGKNFINNDEIFLYHFYRKKTTKFSKLGNKIYSRYDKLLLDDFKWVICFTENYSQTIPYLLESLKNYSNRKCIIYTINFDFNLPENYCSSEQFILRRIDVQSGEKDFRGRDQSILNLKPQVMIDVINSFPNSKFVFIDSDVYLTVNCDTISKYFENLKDYPLINSHVHDVFYVFGYKDYYNEELVSPLHILFKEMGLNDDWSTKWGITHKVNPVLPRKKTNIIVFDYKSKWFFEEQIEIYQKYKNSKTPALLSFHDEDIANAILSKYGIHESLPLLDIEENYDLDLDGIQKYSYSLTKNISPSARIPESINGFICFHGFKQTEDYGKIDKNYTMSILDCEEIFVTYESNTLTFEKNSFMDKKTFNKKVDFKVFDSNNNLITKLTNQLLDKYWIFYINDLILNDRYISLSINESESNKIIYHNVIKLNQND